MHPDRIFLIKKLPDQKHFADSARLIVFVSEPNLHATLKNENFGNFRGYLVDNFFLSENRSQCKDCLDLH